MKTCKHSLFALLAILFFNISALAQSPAILWQKTIGSADDEIFGEMIQTNDGGFMIAASSNGNTSGEKSQNSKGSYDYWLIRLDANGNKIWDKTYGGSADDTATRLRQTPDGGFIVVGYSASGISGDKTEASRGSSDLWILKLDVSGNIQWEKTYGGDDWDNPYAIVLTSDGGYMIGCTSVSGATGDRTDASAGYADYWVLKLSSNGAKQWDKSFGGVGSENCTTLIATSDGNFIVGGHSDSPAAGVKSVQKGMADFWIIKIDGSGNKIWDNAYGGTYVEAYGNILQSPDGGYIFLTTSLSNNDGDKTAFPRGYWLVKLDANGNKQWDSTYATMGTSNWGVNIRPSTDGSYILSGVSDGGVGAQKTEPNRGNYDYWVIKIDANGKKQWDKTIGGSKEDFSFETLAFQTNDGKYMAAGLSRSGVSGDKTEPNRSSTLSLNDLWIVKTDMFPVSIKTQTLNKQLAAVSRSGNTTILKLINSGNTQYRITNIAGAQVASGSFSDSLPLPYAPGIYIITLERENDNQVIKLEL